MAPHLKFVKIGSIVNLANMIVIQYQTGFTNYIWKFFGQRSTNIIRYDIVSLFGKPLHYSKQLHEQNTLEGSSNLKSKSRGGMDRKEGAEFGKVVQLLLLLLCNTFLLL